MTQQIRILTYLIMAQMSLGFAMDDICEDQDRPHGLHFVLHEDPKEEKGTKTGVQLDYSDDVEDNYEDPRNDYEWPGINDDSFYDFFTR